MIRLRGRAGSTRRRGKYLPRQGTGLTSWFSGQRQLFLANRTNSCGYATICRPPVRLFVVCTICTVAKQYVIDGC